MSIGLGPEIDGDTAEYRCVAAIVRSVERLCGRPSRWNGQVREEHDDRYAGSANEDGSIGLSRTVLARIRHAFSGEPLNVEDIKRTRNAIAVAGHEALHLSTRQLDPNAPGSYPTLDPPDKALDEGVTELWTRSQLDNVLYDLGLDHVADGSSDRDVDDPYPAYTSAARGLVDELHRITGQSRSAIVHTLAATDPSHRWEAIAAMVMDRYLEGLEQPPGHEDLRRRLGAALRADLAHVDSIQSSDAEASRQAGDGQYAGRQAVTSLAVAVEEIADDQRAAARIGPAFLVECNDELDQLRGVLAGQGPVGGVARPPEQPPSATGHRAMPSRPGRGWSRG